VSFCVFPDCLGPVTVTTGYFVKADAAYFAIILAIIIYVYPWLNKIMTIRGNSCNCPDIRLCAKNHELRLVSEFPEFRPEFRGQLTYFFCFSSVIWEQIMIQVN
jgi:hypothetical protein